MRVDVYFNLRTKVWSIRHKGRVIHHARYVVLADAVAVVSEKGRQRVLSQKQRSVHAVIRGTLVHRGDTIPNLSGLRPVSYNPYKGPNFYYCDDRTDWNSSALVHFGDSVALV